jgi:hypothetical protein
MLDVGRSAFSERAIEVNRPYLKPQSLPADTVFQKDLLELPGSKIVLK